VLRHYRRAWLRGDVVAGGTVAAYLVPQVMAYAEVTSLPPVTGLWAAMGHYLLYAVLGSRVVAADVGRPRIDYGARDRNRVGRSHRRWCPAGRCCCGSGNCGRRSVPGRLAGSAGVSGESAVPSDSDRLHGGNRCFDDHQPAR
jgi:hypothetical protein